MSTMTQDQELCDYYEQEGHAIPIRLVREMLAFPKYGSKISVALKLAYCTGCRLSEVQRMHFSSRNGNFIMWKLGKNQFGMTRQEYLPDSLWQEISYSQTINRNKDGCLCDLKGTSILRAFNSDVRPYLSQEWRKTVPYLRNINGSIVTRVQYKYQCKGLRKTFSTLMFAYFWKKYSDSNVALEKVSKRMKHNSKWMTLTHYIDMSRELDAMQYSNTLPFDLVCVSNTQGRIGDFMDVPHHLAEYENLNGRPRKEFDRAKALEMMKSKPVQEVAREVNVSSPVLYRLRRNGL